MKAKFLKASLLVGILALSACGPTISDLPSTDDSTPDVSDPSTSEGGNSESSSESTSSEEPVKEYTVTFVNWNDEVLYVDTVKKGQGAVYEGETPTKPSDGTYSYSFVGWDKDFAHVYKDITTKAQFEMVPLHVEADYNEFVKGWEQPGHLYIHYKRKAIDPKEYNNWAIWLWQNAPIDSEGTLWGASDPNVQKVFNEMSTSWMTDIGGTGLSVDQAGACIDIDLHAEGMIGGKTGNPVTLFDAKRLGFLIVKQDTMDGGDHWTSDGGSNTYIQDFDVLSEKGTKAVHLYCNQGLISDFTTEYTGKVIENPVVSDTTGNYRSKYDVKSSETKYGVSKTSESFKELGVGYQIFVASFRDSNGDGLGDIRGIIDALPYLQDLGVEVLWLTPIQASESYHGYDITDFYAVDSKFGTTEDYRELIYKAHKSGMKVLMDFVVNHTSKNNVWFKKSQRNEVGTNEFGQEIKYRDMYHWKYKGDMVQFYDKDLKQYKEIPVEEHEDWYKDGESNYYYYGKFGSNMAELNYDCQATRDLVISMAQYWMGFGLDGFRLDAVKHIYMKDEVPDTTGDIVITDTGSKKFYDEEKMEYDTKYFDYSSDMTKNVNFWKEFAHRIKQVYPDCFLVGENYDGWGTRIAPYYQALDSQFDFALYFHNFQCLYGKSSLYPGYNGAADLANAHVDETINRYISTKPATAKDQQIPGGSRPDFINSPFTSNHDTARLINQMSGTQTTPTESVASSKITGTAEEINRAKVGAASTILMPGISWIYYGDELGMSGNTDTHVDKYGSENNMDLWYRQPFKWADESVIPSYTFDKYLLELDDYNSTDKVKNADASMAADDGDMYDFYKGLIAAKKLYGGNAKYKKVSNLLDPADSYEFEVIANNGTFHIYINSGAHNKTFSISGNVVAALNGASSTKVPPFGVAVVKK